MPLDGGEADNTLGDPIANYLIRNATELGVQFFIWDRSKWNIEYGGPKYYGGSHPHHDHLHIELTPDAAHNGRNFPTPTGGADHDAALEVALQGGGDHVGTGGSKGVRDFFPGETFNATITLKNESDVAWEDPQVGYMIEEPYLKATGYRIEDDHPAHDQKSWDRNDANDNPDNPSTLGGSGKLHMNAMSPGESKRVVIELEATRYSFGFAPHPDVRGWLWHIGGVYGEQTSYHEQPSNANDIGHHVRDYAQTDVFDRDQWQFRGGKEGDHEAWTARGTHDAYKLNVGQEALALHVTGADSGLVSPDWTRIDADRYDELVLRMRSHEGEQTVEVYFHGKGESFSDERVVRFAAPGNGEFNRLVVPIGEHPAWSGEIHGLRIDPFADRSPSGEGWWFDLRSVYLQDAASMETSGGNDEAGYADARRVTLEGNGTDDSGAGDGDDGGSSGNEMTTAGTGDDDGSGADDGTGGRTGSAPSGGGSRQGQTSDSDDDQVTTAGTQASCASTGGAPLPLPVVALLLVLLGLRRRYGRTRFDNESRGV